MKKAGSLTVFALALAAAVLIALPARTYDPNLDHDNNQWIDENDLYYFIQHWHTGPGSSATETPTAQTATSTPTPTPTGDGGDAAKLQVIACKMEEFAGNIVEVWVDQLNADNQIVNPGVQDGAPSRDVTVSLTGQAVFAETEDTSWTRPLNFATGIMYSVKGTAVGQVTVNASSAGVDDAAPLTIDFIEGGAISGTVQVPESVGGNLQPAPFPGVEISVYEAATGEFVLSTMVGLEEDGKYQTPFMAAGLYDVSVDPIYYNHSRMAEDEMLGAECIRGVQVVGGQTTENTDADLAFLTGGARVFGDITLADGGDPLEQGGVTLISQSEDACAQQSFFTAISIDEQSGAASYEFLNVPQGAYSILASGIRNEEALTHPLLTDLDVPASGQLQQDLELGASESVDISQDAPINYQRVASPPSFSWSLAEEPGASLVYRLTVGDRCGNTLWENAEVEASPAVYGGTRALVPNNIYNWSISGSSEDGSIMATVPFQMDKDSEFLVE